MSAKRSSASFDVWSFTAGDDDSWTHRKTISGHEDALAEAKRIGRGATVSVLYERGRFEIAGREVVGYVMFWWSENGYSDMEGEPWGRGYGWSEDYETEVAYEPAESGSLAVQRDPPVLSMSMPMLLPVPEPQPEYVSVACDHCGRIIPMNESRRYQSKRAVGSSSGTYRSSNSTTIRQGSRASSISYRRGSSSSSGRTYYKHEIVTLCRSCYRSQLRSDRLRFVTKALAAVVAFYVWMHYFVK